MGCIVIHENIHKKPRVAVDRVCGDNGPDDARLDDRLAFQLNGVSVLVRDHALRFL